MLMVVAARVKDSSTTGKAKLVWSCGKWLQLMVTARLTARVADEVITVVN